jgi:hypothetical protein
VRTVHGRLRGQRRLRATSSPRPRRAVSASLVGDGRSARTSSEATHYLPQNRSTCSAA